ncbi:hypothetical protein [Flavivirga jejuensis]|uniref:Uncharacterized protein n=1 Tax=Flavivirga jejuensis TaxID=870487 RepID=A0ABT8WPA4_9FLAO|nr:hypothetical protein [Flavivirga jejuensis]MDO5974845.1 hypothetical protein [Flavivirga jejuensis]
MNTFLKPKGFKKKKEDFLICSDIGVNQFGIVISYYGTAGSWLNFSATIGSDAVNKVSKEFDEKTKEFSSDDHSPLITTLTNLKEISYFHKNKVMTLDDADQVLQNFYLDYEKYIGPFFEQYNNLEAIEQYMNRNYELEGYYLSPLFKAQRGIVLAYLVGRKDLGILLEGYISSWRKLTTDERQFQAKTKDGDMDVKITIKPNNLDKDVTLVGGEDDKVAATVLHKDSVGSYDEAKIVEDREGNQIKGYKAATKKNSDKPDGITVADKGGTPLQERVFPLHEIDLLFGTKK